MKQLRYDDYGGIDRMYLADVPKPEPREDQILVEIKAAGINPVDWKIRNAHMKMVDGHQWPRLMGIEFAGIVRQVGDQVTNLEPGDEVFGAVDIKTLGGMADFIVVQPDNLHPKPPSLSMAEAAGLPLIGTTAHVAIREKIDVRGRKLLVNGGSGGVGTIAIQLARMDGAHVTGTAGAHHQDIMRELGATRTVNYEETDITQEDEKYDVILDAAGTIPFSIAKGMLTPHGTYLNLQPGLSSFLSSFINNKFSDKKHEPFLAEVTHPTLHRLYNLVEEHGLKVRIGREYPLMNYKKVFEELESGRGPAGKSVFIP